jgi:serine/threonine protein kinase
MIFLTYNNRRNQWVSLKILSADSSRESQELRNLQLLQQRSQGGPSSKHIVQLLDSFVHEGPNGLHQCLVFELLGPTIGKFLAKYYHDKLKPETILRMSEQLLEAIEFIHNTGIGHGGNVKLYRLFSLFLYLFTTHIGDRYKR